VPTLKELLDMPAEQRDRLVREKVLDGVAPSTSADDDLSVHRQACTWDAQGMLWNYFHALEEALCLIGGEEPDETPSLYSMAHYQVGLYSVAALFTVLDYEEYLSRGEN